MRAATCNATPVIAGRPAAHRRALVAAMVVLLGLPLDSWSLECPAMPQQAQRDWDIAIAGAVGRLGLATGSQLQAQTRTVTTDLLRRLPNADRIYLEQMMYATYCSSLRDNAALTEVERNARIQAYNRELRATLNVAARPAATVDPRDTARADLARLPVEYSSPVFLASAEAGRTAVVRLFLQAGIDPNSADRSGVTALMHAAGRGDLPMMDMLLKAGTAVNARTPDGAGTAMTKAASSGRIDAARLLIKAGATRESFDSALLSAMHNGHLEIFRLLLEHGATARADDGVTGHWLGRAGRVDPARLAEMLKLLLQQGWPIDARNKAGWTELMEAAHNQSVKLMDLLLRAGAQPDLHYTCAGYNGGGYTALTMLAKDKGTENAVRLLLDAGAKVDEPSNDGTPLMVAARHGGLPVFELLLSKGADPNKARDSQGNTALMHAARLGNLAMVSLLLGAAADVNARGQNDNSALMWAASADNATVVQKLLDAGAHVEQATRHGHTALMIAAMNGSIGAARLLVQRGARIDIVDEDNRTAVALADEKLKGDVRVSMLALLVRKESK